MRSAKVLITCLALAFVLLAVSASVAAETVTLSPGASRVVHVNADAGQWLTYTWYTLPSELLHLVVQEPSGTIIEDVTSTSGGDTIFADAGTYTFTWTNTGTSSVTLTYSMPFQDLGNAISWALYAALAIVIIVVVIVVIVVVLATRKKKAPELAPQPLSPMAAQSVAAGRCPQCGRPVDRNGMFCAVCGAKLR